MRFMSCESKDCDHLWSTPGHDILGDLKAYGRAAEEAYGRITIGQWTSNLDLTSLSPKVRSVLESRGYISPGQTSLTL